MAVLSKDEFFKQLHERVGADTSDTAIAFVENMTDTYNDLEKKAAGDGVDWEKRYHDNDEAWRAKYRHRFFSGGEMRIPEEKGCDTIDSEDIRVEDLFESEGK